MGSLPCRNNPFVAGGHSCGVIAKLFLMQQRIQTLLGDQFLMTPLFDHRTLLENQNPVRIANGRKPMSDDERGTRFHQTVEGLEEE